LGLRDADEVAKSFEQSKKIELAALENDASVEPSNTAGLELVRRVAVNTHKMLRKNVSNRSHNIYALRKKPPSKILLFFRYSSQNKSSVTWLLI